MEYIDLISYAENKNYSSMPSNTYEEIEMLETGSEYNAPANGWFTTAGTLAEADKFIAYTNETNEKMHAYCRATTTNRSGGLFLPVKKDDVVKFYYNTTYTPLFFGFLYAEDSI